MRWLVGGFAALVVAPLLLFVVVLTIIGGGSGCSSPSDGSTVVHDGDIARTIVEVGLAVGASERALLAALEAAIVESGVRNLDYGDRDSLGVFQQRPSMGWGTPAQIMNPVYAARAFLLGPQRAGSSGGNAEPGAVARDRSWRGTAGQLAQAVQRSAFPHRYDQVERQARALLTRYLDRASQPAGGAVTAVSPTAHQGFGEWGGYANGRIPTSALRSIGRGHWLRPDAAAAWNALQQAATADLGRPIGVTDSYRSYQAQVAVKAAKGSLAATPGRSNHGWGLALDIVTGGWNGTVMGWLEANAHRYGWQHPDWARIDGSKPEHWHWEFKGGEGLPPMAC